MSLRLNKDTTLCISLSARPSNIGTRFHNFLYEELGLNFVYKAFAPTSIEDAIRGVRGLGIRGAAVSMPFKEAVIPLIDELDPTAAAIESVNTIVNNAGFLTGYNTDFIAVHALIRTATTARNCAVVYGSGGMAKAVVAAFADLGFERIVVVARNKERGEYLAAKYGAAHVTEFVGTADVVVNATSIGMAGGEGQGQHSIPETVVEKAHVVVDLVAVPARTPLIQLALAHGKTVVVGTDIMTLQAVEQFVLYTGMRPAQELIDHASEFSRAD